MRLSHAACALAVGTALVAATPSVPAAAGPSAPRAYGPAIEA